MFQYLDHLKYFSDAKWIAETYSQYLEKRSQNYVALMNTIDEAVQIEVPGIDQIDEHFNSVMDEMTSFINNYAQLEYNIDLKDLSDTDDLLKQICQECSVQADFQTIVSTNFDDTQDILDHLYDYVVPDSEVTVTIPTTIPSTSSLSECHAPDLLTKFKEMRQAAEDQAIAILEQQSLDPSCKITLGAGYVDLQDLLTSIIKDANTISNYSANLSLPLEDVEGRALTYSNNIGYTYDSLVEQIKGNYADAVVYAGGFLASTRDTVTERLQVFNNYLNERLSSAYSGLTSIATSMRTKLADAKTDVSNFFADFMELTGWSQIGGQTVVPDVLDESLMNQYTGSSPVACLDFSTAKDVVVATAKTVAVAVAGVAVAAFNIAKGIFSKVSNFFVHTVVNPYDLESLDNGVTSGLVDGFQFQQQKQGIYVFNVPSEDVTDLTDELSSKVGSWIKYETLFGESLYRINSLALVDVETHEHVPYGYVAEYRINYDYLFKPKPFNSDLLLNIIQQFASEHRTGFTYSSNTGLIRIPDASTETCLDVYNSLCEMGSRLNDLGSLYLDASANEVDFCKAYSTASCLHDWLFRVTLCVFSVLNKATSSSFTGLAPLPLGASSGTDPSNVISWYATLMLYRSTENYGASSVNNLDWVKSVSGYYNKDGVDYWDHYNLQTSLAIVMKGPNIWWVLPDKAVTITPENLMYLLSFVFADSRFNPTDYAYIPYSSNYSSFSEPQYRIKKDSDNNEAFSKFLTIAIIVVIAVVISVKLMMFIKKFARKRFFKKYEQIGQMDNRMWQGKQLTLKEQRKYVRYSRKLAKSSMLTKGISAADEAESLFSKVKSVSTKIDTLYTQVTGNEVSPVPSFLLTKDNSVVPTPATNNVYVAITGRSE